MSRENVEVLGRAHAAFNQGDFVALREVLAEDAEWGTTGAWPGVDLRYRGPDGVERWARDILSVWEVFEVGIDEVRVATAESVVVTERLDGRGAGSGAQVEHRVFSAYWFRDGRVVKRESFLDKPLALEALGLSE